jgi:hypothetical protein
VRSFRSYLGAVKHLQLQHSDGRYSALCESTVRKWFEKGSYSELTAATHPSVRRQCSSVRPYNGAKVCLKKFSETQQAIIDLLKWLRDAGQAIGTVVAAAMVKGVLQTDAPSVLVEHGGKLHPSREWIRLFLRGEPLKWTFRRATTVAQKLPANWVQLLLEMNQRMAIKVFSLGIPKELVYSCDETYLHFVPMSNAGSFAPIGSREVAVVGADDKRGATLNVTCKPDGTLLPFQFIFGGKSPRCLPKGDARKEAEAAGHVFCYSLSHWQTVDTFKVSGSVLYVYICIRNVWFCVDVSEGTAFPFLSYRCSSPHASGLLSHPCCIANKDQVLNQK